MMIAMMEKLLSFTGLMLMMGYHNKAGTGPPKIHDGWDNWKRLPGIRHGDQGRLETAGRFFFYITRKILKMNIKNFPMAKYIHPESIGKTEHQTITLTLPNAICMGRKARHTTSLSIIS